MIEINSKKEMEKYYIKDKNTYIFEDDVEFKVDVKIRYSIKAHNITAFNIDALNIEALGIDACNINACDIQALNIIAWDIIADNIIATNIYASDISYYATCIAYEHFECESVKGRRINSIHKCLDGEIKYKVVEE